MSETPTPDQLPGWAASAWKKVSGYFLLGLFVAGIIVGVLNWWRETFPPASRQDLNAHMDSLRGELVASQVITARLAVHEVLMVYDDSLRAVADTLTTTVAMPMLDRQAQLMQRMKAVERQLGLANDKLDRMPAPDNEAITQLLEGQQRAPRQDQMEVLLKELRLMNSRMDAIEERLPRTKRINL